MPNSFIPWFPINPIRKAGLLYKIPVTISENMLYIPLLNGYVWCFIYKDSPLSLANVFSMRFKVL